MTRLKIAAIFGAVTLTAFAVIFLFITNAPSVQAFQDPHPTPTPTLHPSPSPTLHPSPSPTLHPSPSPTHGTRGCSPGYYKNHSDAFAATGFATTTTLEAAFDVPDSLGYDDTTFEQALDFGGGSDVAGGARILLRQAVAALLNAAHPNVDYPLTPAQVISQVNLALASGDRGTMVSLAGQLDANNNLGCPLN